eukprot:1689379-Pyramimonas_sp.AAC.2
MAKISSNSSRWCLNSEANHSWDLELIRFGQGRIAKLRHQFMVNVPRIFPPRPQGCQQLNLGVDEAV